MLSYIPSFVGGLSRTLDIGSNLTEQINNKVLNKSDFNAIHNDWRIVGMDMKDALNQYENINGEAKSEK